MKNGYLVLFVSMFMVSVLGVAQIPTPIKVGPKTVMSLFPYSTGKAVVVKKAVVPTKKVVTPIKKK